MQRVDALADRVIETLDNGEPVDLALPGGGRLHIDRPLPFLCIHRNEEGAADDVTAALVATQSAWMVVPAPAAPEALLSALADYQQARFGACLLLELWAAPHDDEQLPDHAFCIVAPQRHPPREVIDELESALVKVTIHRRTPRIEVAYRQRVSPPGLPPLPAGGPCRRLGLEVSPVYRDPESGEVFTFAMRVFRQRLNTALKRAFYRFSQCCTRHRPAHFHALGPRSITPAVKAVDARLAEISERFDLLLHVTPVNVAQAWAAFQASRFEQAPEFLYRPRTIDPDRMKRALYQIEMESIEDPTLADIFRAKRDELDRQITLVADRNTPRFLLGSRQLFPDPSTGLIEQARRILEMPPASEPEGGGERLDANAFAALAEAEMARYRARDPDFASRVEVRDDIAGIMVSHGNFLIGAQATVARARVDAALAHEIGTHVLTWHNGGKQPLRELRSGMADYEGLQEGLAVLSEFLVGQLDRGRMRQLAARVLAVQMICAGASFIDAFRQLHRGWQFTARDAFMITMRVWRGGGYTKDVIYLRGLADLLDHLGRGGALENLWLGKLAQQRLSLIDELRWRGILRPPALIPAFLDDPRTASRIRRLAKGLLVSDLLPAQ